MKRSVLVLLAICWYAPVTSAATITVFNNDEAGWQSAVGGSFTTETFSSPTLNPGLSVTTSAGSISGGLWQDRVVHGGDSTTWNFTSPIAGFGGNWDLSPGGPGQGIEFLVTFVGGGTQLVPGEVPNSFTGQFFGFVSNVPIVSVREDGGTQGGNAETHNLDNLVYSSAAIPEPTSLALFGMTIGAAGLFGWRRRKQAACA
jgi:hypothetical protein